MGDHYLPRYLLSGFALPAGRLRSPPVVVTYDLTRDGSPRQLTIASVANETGMYAELEARLQAEVEQPVNDVLERLRRAGGPVLEADVQPLSRYFITAIRRVPQGRASSLSLLPDVASDRQEAFMAAIDELERTGEGTAEYLTQLRVRVKRTFRNILTSSPEWLWRQTLMPEMFERAVAALSSMKWTVLRTPPGKQVLISDVPVVRDAGVGLAKPDALWMLPISSDTLLAASWVGSVAPIRLSAREVHAINAKTIAQATRYVFGKYPERWIDEAIEAEAERRAARRDTVE